MQYSSGFFARRKYERRVRKGKMDGTSAPVCFQLEIRTKLMSGALTSDSSKLLVMFYRRQHYSAKFRIIAIH